MKLTDKAMEEFQKTLEDYHRLLQGHRLMKKFYPKWRDELDTRINLDIYTAERSLSVLPANFAKDEKIWIEALQTRMKLINKNLEFVHEQRQQLEKVHKNMSKLISIFNKTQKFFKLEDLPGFEPQNCERKNKNSLKFS